MMTRTFAEMCAERDPLYAATKPVGEMRDALQCELASEGAWSTRLFYTARDIALFRLTIRALRNQGEPYYRV